MKIMKKFRSDNEGVSEVVGTVLLLAIAISAFSVLAMYVFSNTGTTPSPHVNLVGYMDENHNAIVEHNGGDSLPLQNIRIIIWKGEEASHEFMFTTSMLHNYNHSISLGGNSMFYDTTNNKKWDVGDYIKIDCPAIFGNITHWQISVMVIDKESNSIIMSGILQQGILHTVPPVAMFTYEPLNPKTGRGVIFNASQSYDPDGGAIVQYIWDFGDGVRETKYSPVVTHQYSQPGVYHVSLTVIDNEGEQTTVTAGVGVGASIPPVNVTVNKPPVAYFTNTTLGDGWVYFDASQSYDPDGTVVKYIWDFGDGHTQIKLYDPTIKWQYAKGGQNYTVTLVVEDNDGGTSASVTSITLYGKPLYVPPIPPVAIIKTPADISTASAAFFSAADSYDPDGDALVNFSWDFDGDGIPDAYGVNVTYHFYQVGNYTINLTVVDSSGGVGYATRTIYVRAPIAARRFLIVDNTPVNRGFDGISNILRSLNIGDVYDYGKAIDLPNNYFYSYHNATGWYNWSDGNPVSILAKLLDEYDIVIWSTGNFPGDGNDDGVTQFDHYNYWTTPMTEGYDDYSDHVYEIATHLDHNGTLLLCGAYAARDLQDYWGNWANQDEIDLGNRLGLVEPTGGIDESLHSSQIGYFTDGSTFGYGPIYAKGVLHGLPGTSSGGVNLTIEQPIPMYSLVKQSSSDFEYSLQSNNLQGSTQQVTVFQDDFSTDKGWTHGGVKDEWQRSWQYPSYPPYRYSWLYGTDVTYSYDYPYDGNIYYENNANCWLESPSIDLTGYSSATLQFMQWYSFADAGDKVILQIESNGNWYTLATFTGRQTSWKTKTYDISQYVGGIIKLRWKLITNGYGRDYGYYLDNVEIDGTTVSTISGNFAIDSIRGQNRSIVLGFDLNSPYINDTDRERYILNVVNWMAEVVGYPTVIYVDNNKPQSWYDDTHVGDIQDAIDRVMVGGTIYVNGTTIPYTSINVIKSVNIIGVNIGNGYPTIRSNGEYAVKIGVDWVTIRNFKIDGMGNLQKGIYLEGSSSTSIINCNISHAIYGIYAISSNYLTIKNNRLFNNTYNIYAERCVKGEIKSNHIYSADYGIYAKNSPKLLVDSNELYENSKEAIYLDSSDSITIQANTLYGNAFAIYSYSSSSLVLQTNNVFNNTYGIHLEQSTNPELVNNNITNNVQTSVTMANYSNGGNIFNNAIKWNGEGIKIINSNYITVSNNVLYNNINNVKIDRGNNNIITQNEIRNGSYGIYLSSSISNQLYNNSIWNCSRGIYADSIMDSQIMENVINESGNAITLYSSHPSKGNNSIVLNVIYNCEYGITLSSRSDENEILNNTISNIDNWGICVQSFSTMNNIMYNNITGSPYGIYIKDSSYNNISFNIVSSPTIAIYLSSADSNTLANNSVTGIYYGIYVSLGSNDNEIINSTIQNCLYGVYVSSSYSTTITSNIIINSTDGILLENADTASINENILSANVNGIHLISSGGSGNIIQGNTIFNNSGYGILLENSKASIAGNNEIAGNKIYNNNESGIYLYSSNTNSIQQNEIYGNKNGILMNLSDDNTIDSNSIYDNTEKGLCFISSNGNRIDNNTISFNDIGIYFYKSSQGDQYKIGGNRIWNNTYGVFLDASDSNYFGYNLVNVMYNNTYGIYIIASSNNHFSHNIIWDNGYGAYMTNSSTSNEFYENNFTTNNYSLYIATGDCSSNTIFSNNFINNTLHNNSQAWDTGNNSWYVSTTGNYWSDYNGTDGDGNGRGDTPYTIPPSLNRDLYPLMEEVKWW